MGKEDAFVQVIKRHEGIIFKITTVYTDNSDDQKDLYQDIVFQLWKSFDSFRNQSKVSTWMYRVAMNTALTYIRKKTRSGDRISIDKVVVKQTDSDHAEYQEKLEVVYKHIHQLNLLEKGLMLLLLEGKSYDEMAEITGLSPSNVGTRISRIKQRLKSKINTL